MPAYRRATEARGRPKGHRISTDLTLHVASIRIEPDQFTLLATAELDRRALRVHAPLFLIGHRIGTGARTEIGCRPSDDGPGPAARRGAGVTAIMAALGGPLWPGPAGDITVPIQALASMILVRWRGHVWVTRGAVLMWLGISLQTIGVTGWAAAFLYPSDPALDPDVGTALAEAVNDVRIHLFGPLIVGADHRAGHDPHSAGPRERPGRADPASR